MRVIVLGTRGFPDVQGGVETHCEELYPRLVDLGCDVTVVTRTPYISKQRRIEIYKGVKTVHLFAPKVKSLEAIFHTFIGVLYARIKSPDILHIHGIGPSILIPLAKLLQLKVVMTNHGQDYNRKKWGRLAKAVLMVGERWGTRYADKIIAISETIKQTMERKYKRYDTAVIPNGVNLPEKSWRTGYLMSLGLQEGKYVIGVGRFVPEKGFHDLIDAFSQIAQSEHKLVLVGDADHESRYSKRLKQKAFENGVILTGFIKGEQLNQIFSHARLLVMPSYHEGSPIALLEAMSYNLNVLVSDIPANLDLGLNKDDYCETGNIASLRNKIKDKLSEKKYLNNRKIIITQYNWNYNALKTYALYRDLLNSHSISEVELCERIGDR